MGWSDLAGILKKKKSSVRRGWRKLVRMPVTVIEPDGRQTAGEIVESSPNGFQVRCPHKMSLNVPLKLRFMGIPYGEASKGSIVVEVPAEMVWNRKETVGAFPFLAGGRFMPASRDQWRDLCSVLLGGPGLEIAELDEQRSQGRLIYHGSIGDQDMVVRDVSESGAGLLVRHPVVPNARMEIELAGADGPFYCRGRVVRCKELLKGRIYHVGLAFEKLDRRTRDHLATFLADLLLSREEKPTAST